MAITETMHIECPPEAAFDLMADVRRLTDWNEGATRAEMTSAGPIREGSRFVAVNRGQEMESTITRFDRPERLDFSVTGKVMDVTAAFRFAEAGSATTLAIEFQPHPKGVMKILFPVLRPVIRRDLRNQHLKFKDNCESERQTHNS